MTKRKSDWQKARELADYICSLGDFKHDIYKDGVAQGRSADGIKLYTDQGYVSCCMQKDGEEYLPFTCFQASMPLPEINADTPNFKDVVMPDINKITKAYMKELKPLEESAQARKEQQRKEKIKDLKNQIKDLKGAKDE